MEVNMKTFLATLVLGTLLVGCAHRGGMSDESYRETGIHRGADGEFNPHPTSPSTIERDFPGRIGPGSNLPERGVVR
jgi:hypothetical protein